MFSSINNKKLGLLHRINDWDLNYAYVFYFFYEKYGLSLYFRSKYYIGFNEILYYVDNTTNYERKNGNKKYREYGYNKDSLKYKKKLLEEYKDWRSLQKNF